MGPPIFRQRLDIVPTAREQQAHGQRSAHGPCATDFRSSNGTMNTSLSEGVASLRSIDAGPHADRLGRDADRLAGNRLRAQRRSAAAPRASTTASRGLVPSRRNPDIRMMNTESRARECAERVGAVGRLPAVAVQQQPDVLRARHLRADPIESTPSCSQRVEPVCHRSVMRRIEQRLALQRLAAGEHGQT